MSELAKLSNDLAAQTEAFLRAGGSITQLNHAGVPIDGTPAEPKPVRAYGRLPELPPREPKIVAKPLPKPKPAAAAPAPAPAPAHVVPELRRLRADARAWLARLNRSFPQ